MREFNKVSTTSKEIKGLQIDCDSFHQSTSQHHKSHDVIARLINYSLSELHVGSFVCLLESHSSLVHWLEINEINNS